MKLSSIAAVAISAASVSQAPAETFVPTVFSDHMVVQQNKPFCVFGKDNPGQQITIVFADRRASAKASADGAWRVAISPPPAGGPYEVSIEGSTTRTISDVLVGEVWLCSGQSNMQFALSGAINAQQEIAAADFPQIRLYNVPNVRSREERDDVSAKWQLCSPKTVSNFSAVGYFFGRQLHQDLKVPVGLINSSWGGTHAEAWTPREELSALPGMKEQLDGDNADQLLLWKEHGKALAKWMAGLGIVNDAGDKAGWAAPGFDDGSWKTLALPAYWQRAGIAGNGLMWFRRSIEIPAGLDLSSGATLELGGIDDLDTTYINGQLVGKTDADVANFWSAPRKYTVPAGVLKPGSNTIAVRVVDIGGDGGFGGDDRSMRLTVGQTAIPLAGDWKYNWERQVVIPGDSGRPQAPAGDIMMTELYNAMIHPFEGFPIAGAIWYQGESNAGKTGAYKQLLSTMIGSWRKRWDDNFTFLIVQLAGWQSDTGRPDDAPGWAYFREVQEQIAETVPNAGMALAIDIGDSADIHPKNKQDVGKRLALQALKITYGRDVVAAGPKIASAKADGAKVILSFENVAGGLLARDNDLSKNFTVQDKRGTWAWADAKIVGEQIILSSPEVTSPVKVRYAWQNTPPASLYNKPGLPALPFQVDVK